MKKILLILILLNTTLFSNQNIFIIKNSNGKVIKGKKIRHNRNSFFNDLIKNQKILLSTLESRNYKRVNFNKNHIIKDAKQYLGGKYVWGGTKPKGFDCSGYVKYLYEKEGIELPRTAYQQSKMGKLITRDKLKKGDLLFFLTDKKRHIPITHVGMYIGNDKFIHAASRKKGIIISSFSKSKYSRYFVKAKRIIQ